jgi:hypothetical protein
MKPSLWSGCSHYPISLCVTLIGPVALKDLHTVFYTIIQ